MFTYILKGSLRFCILLPLLSVMVFWLISKMPSHVDELMQANPNMKAEDAQRLREYYGEDKPVLERYMDWVSGLVKGDLGFSIKYSRKVTELLAFRIPNTLKLTAITILFSLAIAIPLGVIAGVKQYSIQDYIINTTVFIGISTPVFWLGLLLIYFFGVENNWLPISGDGTTEGAEGLLETLKYMILPVFTLSFASIGSLTRYQRAALLEVIQSDYIRTARAKGLSNFSVVGKHALRNSLIPVVTVLALSMPFLFSGALITEKVFNWPGMGLLLYESVMSSDRPVAMTSFMIIASLTVFFNFIADIIYVIIDPRIRYG